MSREDRGFRLKTQNEQRLTEVPASSTWLWNAGGAKVPSGFSSPSTVSLPPLPRPLFWKSDWNIQMDWIFNTTARMLSIKDYSLVATEKDKMKYREGAALKQKEKGNSREGVKALTNSNQRTKSCELQSINEFVTYIKISPITMQRGSVQKTWGMVTHKWWSSFFPSQGDGILGDLYFLPSTFMYYWNSLQWYVLIRESYFHEGVSALFFKK